MNCLLHQVLVAMLTATPVPDDARAADAVAPAAITRPADLGVADARKVRVVVAKEAKKAKAAAVAARVPVEQGVSLN